MPSEEAIAAAEKIAIRIGEAKTDDRLAIAIGNLIRIWAAETELRATEELAAIIDEALGKVWDAAIEIAGNHLHAHPSGDGARLCSINGALNPVITDLSAAKARALSGSQPEKK